MLGEFTVACQAVRVSECTSLQPAMQQGLHSCWVFVGLRLVLVVCKKGLQQVCLARRGLCNLSCAASAGCSGCCCVV